MILHKFFTEAFPQLTLTTGSVAKIAKTVSHWLLPRAAFMCGWTRKWVQKSACIQVNELHNVAKSNGIVFCKALYLSNESTWGNPRKEKVDAWNIFSKHIPASGTGLTNDSATIAALHNLWGLHTARTTSSICAWNINKPNFRHNFCLRGDPRITEYVNMVDTLWISTNCRKETSDISQNWRNFETVKFS